GSTLLRLDVEVPEDLEVVRDEADRGDEHALDAVGTEPVELLEHVRAEPRLAGRARALEREGPALEARALRDEARCLQQLLPVRIAFLQDPRRQRVCGEDGPGV